MDYSYTNLALALAITGAASIPIARSCSSQRKYHPGPTPLPVIGNLLQIPRETPWKTYKEWTKTYGEFYCRFSAYNLTR